MADIDPLRFPIGRFHRPQVPLTDAARSALIEELAAAPGTIRSLVTGASEATLDTPYRPGGWTVRQVVHHVPDSHMNGYIRMKWALTEDQPLIKVYAEAKWAELPEARSAPVALSLDLLDAIHRRWTALLRALPAQDFEKTYTHPELGPLSLDVALALYAWHGKHHAGHIRHVIS
jgi:hypothetical protein